MTTDDLIVLLVIWNFIGFIISFIGPLMTDSKGAFGSLNGLNM